MEISSALEGAHWAIAQGWRVFPLEINSKLPACKWKNWSGAIEPWLNAGYNYGIDCTGLTVLDIDGWDGEESLATLNPLPPTLELQTRSGGRHIVYAGSSANTSGTKLGHKVDTRSDGGYIVGPGSRIDGQIYRILHDRPIAPVPDFIRQRLASQNQRHASVISELDGSGSLDRAARLVDDYVGRGDLGREGAGSDDRTYRLACELLDLGLTQETCCDLLMERWAPYCDPPFDRDWIERKVQNAANHKQNDIGAYGVDDASTAFGQIPDVALLLAASAHAGVKRSRFYPLGEAEQDNAPDPQWLIPNAMQMASTVLLVGPSRSYKSFLALDAALAIASGRETFGVVPSASGVTIYAAAEGRIGLKKRRNAWKIARDVAAIPDFYVTPAPMVAISVEVQEFGDEIRKRLAGRSCRLIVLDTLSKVMAGLNENDARDANMLVKFCDSLVEALGCSVLVIHHTGKDSERGARGSSAYFAGFDTVLEVKAHQKTKAVEVWCRKHKDAEEPERPWTFEGHTIAGSLVFSPTSQKEHRMLAAEGDEFAGKRIGAALAKLGAYGQGKGIVSHVLARELTPAAEYDDPEAHEKQIGRTARSLSALSKSKLEAYCERVGRELLWFLPAPGVEEK